MLPLLFYVSEGKLWFILAKQPLQPPSGMLASSNIESNIYELSFYSVHEPQPAVCSGFVDFRVGVSPPPWMRKCSHLSPAAQSRKFKSR